MDDADEAPTEDIDYEEVEAGHPEFDQGLEPVRTHWEDVVEDVEATAMEYEERGWETLVVRPGDVTPLVGEEVDRQGFDVLLPDDEFEDLLDVVADATFDASDVYASVEGGVVFLMVALQDEQSETAVLFPAYHKQDGDTLEDLREHATETGQVKTHLRRLREDRVVTFAYENPGLFFPESDDV